MNLTELENLVAKRTGLTVAQSKSDIDSAISGAMLEYGIHVGVPAAQKTESKTIAAGANYVSQFLGYGRIVSATYRYSSGSDYQLVPLTGVNISELDRANRGMENYESDSINMFAPFEDQVYVGPGKVDTGGTIIIRSQRELTFNDIDKLPNPMAIVMGATANLLPIGDEHGAVARMEFKASWLTEGPAARPINQQYAEVELPEHIKMDDSYRSTL